MELWRGYWIRHSAGEWNTLVLKCQKTAAGTYRCEHRVNGTPHVTYEIGSADWNEKVAKTKFAAWKDFGKAAAGHICLQSHGDEVAFRNLKIRELPALERSAGGRPAAPCRWPPGRRG